MGKVAPSKRTRPFPIDGSCLCELPENVESGQRDLTKIRISVALSGAIIQWTYFTELTLRIEPLSWLP